MSKLVDKERLAKLAKSLDDRAKAAVAAEATRADAAEKAIDAKADQNAAAIAAINNEETGILKQAKDYADEKDGELNNKINAKVAQTDYDAKMLLLDKKDSDQQADILALQNAVDSLEEKMGDKDMAGIQEAIDDFKTEQQGVDSAQDQKVAALEEALNGNGEDVPGLIAEVGAIEGRLDNEGGLVDRIEAVEDFVAAQPAKDEALQGEIDAVEGRMDAVEEFVEDHDHSVMEGKIAALEELHKENGAVDQKVAAVQQAVEDLQSEFDTFEQTQASKDQEQNTAIAAKVAQADYNAKVQELEDEDTRLNQAIVDEAARAAAAEKANADAILAINNADTGILAQAKAHAQGLVDGEKGLREQADAALDNRLTAIENSVGEGGALEGKVAANEAKLAGLEEGCDTVQAAINKAEADAKDYADQQITALVDSAPDAMNTLNELAAAINAHGTEYEAYVATVSQNIATAKQEAINDAAGKDAALKTELQAEIDADVKVEADRAKAEEADIRADFAAADTALKQELQGEIDADVKVEKERAEVAEEALADRLDVLEGEGEGSVAKAIEDAVKVEENRALAQEAAIRSEFATADQGLSQRLSDVESLVGIGGDGQQNALQVLQGEIDAVEEDVQDLKDADIVLQGNIDKKVEQTAYDTKVQALEGADAALANRIKVFEANGDLDVAALKARVDEAEGDIDDLEAFVAGHNHDQMIADIAANAKAIEDNRKACQDEMAQEVLDRNTAIADALETYSTTEEMKAILGNVVSSLALTMENDKVVLRLGGKEGIAVTEVSLDMATDDDINEIITGLDAE